MRSAGCVINDYADRNFDGAVERTKNRPLAAGRVSGTEALQLFVLLLALSASLLLFLNWQTMLLSGVAVLLAAIYPFMKRVTHLPQVASCAHHHLLVSKQQTDLQTVSTVKAITTQDRVSELARMLGGSEASEVSLAHARELLTI